MPQRPPSRAVALGLARARPRATAVWLSAGLVIGAAGLAASTVEAQSVKSSASPQTAPAKPTVASKPLWRDLTARQQKALQPLSSYWDEMTEPHKRKWLAVSRDFAKMSPEEQEMLHSRMSDWASLTNQQRAQARANFANVKQVPVDERKAKWEAYQALSDEEKGKLAERAKSAKAPGAAPTIRLVPEQKLVPIPAAGPDGQHTPRIQLAPPPAPAPVAAARPVPVPAPAPAPVAAPAPSVPPVSAEAQFPPPSATDAASKASEQPASAP
ncbi:DUF3106 domain-containing protein [Variovorax sp. Sphag1AA]|uniref:DUF3106 domain-containing protein n=1 Tax=Variovorax sp. Sphag1AA TaxID=2587027 RepID=UPI0016220297|nr:DUF3106 domain-containing protein [Variovorax sp. Sphag1AA]MBB3176552.1 hypothetical protein [Variovorax sp. Sphag1AA]